MIWLMLLPVVWLLVATVVGTFVGTCIRVQSGEHRAPQPAESPRTARDQAGSPVRLTSAASRTSAPLAP
jgi:hypothetical protein